MRPQSSISLTVFAARASHSEDPLPLIGAAMTAKNQLIGVASIGIQVSGLSQSIRGSLGKALVRRARSHIINPSGVDLLCQPEVKAYPVNPRACWNI